MGRLLILFLALMSYECKAAYVCETKISTSSVDMPAAIQWQRETPSGWYTTNTPRLVVCDGWGLIEWVYVFGGEKVGVLSYDGKSYNTYSTALSGINYIIEIMDYSKSAWVPVTSSEITGWRDQRGSATPAAWALQAGLRIKFVSAVGVPIAGSLKLPGFDIATVQPIIDSKPSGAQSKITAPGANFAIKSKSCFLKSPGTVKLSRLDSSQFKDIGVTAGEIAFQFTVDCSDAYVKYAVSYFMTDVNNPANTGTTLTSATDSTNASGIAIEVRDGSIPVTFGPDLTTENKREIGTVAMAGGSLIKPLTARYKRTDAVVTPGPLSAGVTITLVYD